MFFLQGFIHINLVLWISFLHIKIFIPNEEFVENILKWANRNVQETHKTFREQVIDQNLFKIQYYLFNVYGNLFMGTQMWVFMVAYFCLKIRLAALYKNLILCI
jgi:hypothetical protein